MAALNRAFGWAADHVGDIYLAALVAATIGSVALAVVLALVGHQWLWALVPLAWPALWLWMRNG